MKTAKHRWFWTNFILAFGLSCYLSTSVQAGIDAGRARWTKQAAIPT